MIELVLVIVILGIISLFTFEMTLQIFRSYTYSKMINTLEFQTEITLEQIAKRLGYRVKTSPIARKRALSAISHGIDLGTGDFLPTLDPRAKSSDNYNILEFVPYAYEAFRGGISPDANKPTYTGVADVDLSSSAIGLKLPGSKVKTNQKIFEDLAPNIPTGSLESGFLAIFFKDIYKEDRKDIGYMTSSASANPTVATITSIVDDETVKLDPKYIGKNISEIYHIAYTANAIVPQNINTTNGDFDLILYYDYRPWKNQKFPENASNATLAKNVTRFNFKEDSGDAGGAISLKLCIRASKETTGIDSEKMSICKSKAVY